MKKFANEWLVLKHSIAQALGVNSSTVDEPNKEGFGDFSFPCFNIAKVEGRNPKEVAEVAAGEMKALPEISEAKALLMENNFKGSVNGGYRGPNNCYVCLPSDGMHVEVHNVSDVLLKDIISILSPTCYINWPTNGMKVYPISKLALK